MTVEELKLIGDILWGEHLQWQAEWQVLLEDRRLATLLLYLFPSDIPVGIALECKKNWQAQTVASMKFEFALKNLYARLNQANIDAIPLKGAYLAYHVYPNPTLRPFGDLDILVRKGKLSAFTDVLEQDGWTVGLDAYSDHHAGMRHKNGVAIEPHFNLPNFPDGMEEDIWKEAVPLNGHIYHFTPEMTLLMLCQHNSICQFQNTDMLKLLLDVTFLLKKFEMDWGKVAELARHFRVPNPVLLIRAFPEYFPERIAAGIVVEENVARAYRELLLYPKKFDIQQEIEAHSGNRWTPDWIRRHLRGFSTASICWKYHLKKKQFFRIQMCRVADIFRKVGLICGCGERTLSPEVREHLKNVSLVENTGK